MANPRIVMMFVLLSAGAAVAFSQNAQTILRYDDPALSLLRSIYLEQGKEPLATDGPFSLGEISMMMDKIDPSTLSPAGAVAYNAIKAEIATKPAPKPMALRVAAEPTTSVEGYYHTNQDPSQTDWQEGYSQRLPLVSIPTQIWIGDNAFAEFDLSIRQNPDGLNESLVPQNYLNWTKNWEALDYEIPQRAFVGLGGDDWSFSIGRDRFSWGNGESGDSVISDAPDYYDFGRLTLFWPSFKYSFLWIMLDTNLEAYGTPQTSTGIPPNYVNDNIPRNFILHRMDFSIFDKVTLSALEGMLIGGVQPDIVDFNPVMILHDLFNFANSSIIMAVEADVNPWKYLELYGQAASNKLVSSAEVDEYGVASQSVANTYALIGGARSRIPLFSGYLNAGAEYTAVSPWMYVRENPLVSYEWWRYLASNVPGSGQWESQPLGYFTGPDALVFYVWAGYDVPNAWSVSFDYENVVKGEQSFSTAYVESIAAAALTTPTGTPQYTNIVHFRGSIDPLPFLRLATDLYWIWCDNFNHVSGAQTSDFQASASVTVHASL